MHTLFQGVQEAYLIKEKMKDSQSHQDTFSSFMLCQKGIPNLVIFPRKDWGP